MRVIECPLPTRDAHVARFLLDGFRRRPHRSGGKVAGRRGLSLLELILVLGVMIMIAAMAIPIAHRSFAGQTLDKGADRVRAEMGKARVRAIRTGDLHAFFYMPNGEQFRVAPFFDGLAQIADGGRSDRPEQRTSNFEFNRDWLPRGVRFAAGQAVLDARAVDALSDNQSTTMKPVLFYPDGTSQDALLTLQNEQGDAVEIHLRGLTGTSSIKKVIN
jgi:hypothetical protein